MTYVIAPSLILIFDNAMVCMKYSSHSPDIVHANCARIERTASYLRSKNHSAPLAGRPADVL
jgi:hypothetical protein